MATGQAALGMPRLLSTDVSSPPPLYVEDGVILYQDRVVVLPTLRRRVLTHLHAAHQGTSLMEQRARTIVYWPGMTRDIQDTRDRCIACNKNAPSQADMPPIPASPPSTPFEAVFADFFDYGGHHYLVVGDRLSGWVEVSGSSSGTVMAGASGLVRHLRSFFGTFGVPEEISTDGGPEFTAGLTQEFFRIWNVRHRVSSAHFPASNGREEVAVKTVKRLLMSNTGPTGSLNHDGFLRAMLQLRNTPDPDCNVSPAQVVFGRPLRDAFSFVNRLEKFSNPNIRPLWRDAWTAKEVALQTRMTRSTEALTVGTRPLRPLLVGEHVFIQNQQGTHPTKWDRSGIVVETLGQDQHCVKVDGTGRLTRRNRRFLRAFRPVTLTIAPRQTVANSLPEDTVSGHRPPGCHPATPRSPSTREHHGTVDPAVHQEQGPQSHDLIPEPPPRDATPLASSPEPGRLSGRLAAAPERQHLPDHSEMSPPTPDLTSQGAAPLVQPSSPRSDPPSERFTSTPVTPRRPTAAAPPTPNPLRLEGGRPTRRVRPPKRYDAATGLWI